MIQTISLYKTNMIEYKIHHRSEQTKTKHQVYDLRPTLEDKINQTEDCLLIKVDFQKYFFEHDNEKRCKEVG